MRSIAEIDRDHEGMGRACVHQSSACTYPACECDRSKRIVPNVRGIGGPGSKGETCVHNDDERHCSLCQRHARQFAHGVMEAPAPLPYEPTPDMIAEGWRAATTTREWTHEAVRYFWQRMARAAGVARLDGSQHG